MAIARTRCSRDSRSIVHLRRNLLGSRSDDHPRGLYRLREDRKRPDECTRRSRRIHHMDFLQILLGRSTYSCRAGWDSRRWCRMIPAWRTRWYPCTAPRHRLQNLVCTCRRNALVDYSIRHFQRTVLQSMDLDIRQYLEEWFIGWVKFNASFSSSYLRNEDHLPRIPGSRYM